MTALAGKRALVTGGTSGLGLEIARRFVAEGASVVFTGRDERRGAEAARRTGATFVRADATRDDEVAASVAAALERLGGLDVLVLNAGTGLVAPLAETPPDELTRILDVNVVGYLRYARACLDALAAGGGSIINIASDAAVLGEPEIGAYSVSKAAVVMLGRMLAIDAGARGVRSNVVCPGDIAPGMREMVAPGEGEGEGERDDDVAGWPVPPVGRIGEAADVAGVAVFLAGDDAAFCNGSVILVDGGMRAGMRAGGRPVS